MSRLLQFLAPATLWAASAQPAVALTATDLVVVANGSIESSVSLASYYMERRGVPASALCRLDLPVTEDISREEYDSRLRDPLLAWLKAMTRVKAIVCIRGVPSRIEDSTGILRHTARSLWGDGLQTTDRAAVDSELALLLQPPSELAGPARNPFFHLVRWPEDQDEGGAKVLVVTRLDGPSPQQVRALIDASVDGDRYGLCGRGYFDTRGLVEGGYLPGDYWITEACNQFRRIGLECILDRSPGVFPPDYPMGKAAVYFGWYTTHVSGPFERPGFSFMPGAIAYHLHSYAAATLRREDRHWSGPLLARGVTATMGAVYEPFLHYTPRLDLFARNLTSGLTFGESAYLAMPGLSWMITVVGDPLYRPFGAPLAEQIAAMEADGRGEVVWGYLRHINLLVNEGRLHPALAYTRERIQATNSGMLREKLGDLYALNELWDDALGAYRLAQGQADGEAAGIRIAAKRGWVLRGLGRPDEAEAVEAEVRKTWPTVGTTAWWERVEKAATEGSEGTMDEGNGFESE